MPRVFRATLPTAVAIAVGACAGSVSGHGAGRLPPAAPPPATGPLALRIVYPPLQDSAPTRPGERLVVDADSTYRLGARDSTFLFGSVGRGDAHVHVNGRPVAVYATGGWIAWVPLSGDSVETFAIVATAAGDTAQLVIRARAEDRYAPPASGVWIDTTSLSPIGNVWVQQGEGTVLRLRASPGAVVRLVLPDGRDVPFVHDPDVPQRPWGFDAFDTALGGRARQMPTDRYAGWIVGTLGEDPGPVAGSLRTRDTGTTDTTAAAVVEAAEDGDTLRVAWPLRIGMLDSSHPVLVRLDDDTASTGTTDSITPGRPTPHGTYHWFFPTGTIAAVSGRRNDQVRLALAEGTSAWVDAGNVVPLPFGTPPLRAVARSPRLVSDSASVVLRVPVSARIPFRVAVEGNRAILTLYGASADMDWIQHGPPDPFVERVAFDQPRSDVITLTVYLTEPPWGYRTRWIGTDLHLQVRRPPRIDRGHPLRGRMIALDAGHPPLGATGPTGVREPDVTLAVVRRAARLLRRAGARVFLTRADTAAVSLVDRVRRAEAADADVLVSVHANALPDGINPFTNNGTSVYFFHPGSAALARALDRALVAELGFPDLGYGRADLALARPTWMPAALMEGLFMMLPDQEAVLSGAEGQERYARGIVRGLESYLAERAAAVR